MKILSHLSPYFRTSFLTREFFLENNSVAHFIVHLYLFISIYYFTTTTPPSMMSRFVRGIRTWTRTSAVHSDVGHQINSTAVSARISRIQLDLHRSQLVQHKHQRVSGEKLPRFLSAHSSSNSRGNLSSIRDPDPSLFLDRTATLSNVKSVAASSPSSLDGNHVAEGRSTSTTNLAEVTQSDQMDALLRNDVRTMGAVLGRAIQDHSGEDVFNKVEKLRSLAKNWREAGAGRDKSKSEEASNIFNSMAEFASSMSDKDLFVVSRAFTHFLGIANAAEAHHRSRLNRRAILKNEPSSKRGKSSDSALNISSTNKRIRALRNAKDSCGGALYNLLHGNSVDGDVDRKAIYDTLCNQKVELVLTAHPTEVNRRTLLDKKKRVQQLLTQADGYRSTDGFSPFEQQLVDDCLSREISSIWQSDEVSRIKPTPQAEAQRGTLVVEAVLWEAVPHFLRKLDATMRNDLGGEKFSLPLKAAPIKFASWMGGDRDGNPNVTPNVTREVCLTNRVKAAALFYKDLAGLSKVLSITNCSEEMRIVVGYEREPYRSFFESVVLKKLLLTSQWANDNLKALRDRRLATPPEIHPEQIYLSKSDLLNDLLLVHRSLCDTGNTITANGQLTDIIRNVSAFGLTLVPLDIRQESDRHTEALDAVTRFLGVGSFDQWDESTRVSWLQKQLASNRPLIRQNDWNNYPDIFSPTSVDTLETFRVIAEQYDDSLGAYVISQATTASDVLAVLLLQRDAGVKSPLRVVPLFETLDDLKGAAKTMDQLFSIPGYMGSIMGKQEVMIGYSDSAKDAGRLAASWAQFETQEQLAKVAAKHSVDLTFFHGKGGSVGRGGNPATFDAILAHAPGTVNGQFRVTEQGEMIDQNFGTSERAERTLDIYTAAVLVERYTARPSPTPEWRILMGKLSDVSCEAYRQVVRVDERFVPYFRSATPELELSNLNIGSRPAKRKAGGGVESLRAIPWIFAWTQTRFNLPTWLGVGNALEEMLNDKTDAPKLRDMYSNWKSFSTTIDLVEMVLAKSEPVIASHYENTLVKDVSALKLGKELRGLHIKTEDAVLKLTGHNRLCENNDLLQRVLQVRNPYVDALNVMQAETLKRLRSLEELEGGKRNKDLDDALLITITGIANGMGNTG